MITIPKSDILIIFSLLLSIIGLYLIIYSFTYNKYFNIFSLILFLIGIIILILLILYRKHLKGFL